MGTWEGAVKIGHDLDRRMGFSFFLFLSFSFVFSEERRMSFCLLFSSHLFFLFNVAVCKDPPYKVEESGYAGFILPIEVYFKNKVCNLYPLIFQ